MVQIKLPNNTRFEVEVQNDNASQLPNNVEILVQLYKQTENSISHLRRSNKELQEFDPDKKDSDFQAALIENTFVIMRQENLMKVVADKILELNPIAYEALTKDVAFVPNQPAQQLETTEQLPVGIDL